MPKEHDKHKNAEEKILPSDIVEVMLDHAKVKYSLIPLASVRAKELRASEEHRGRPTAEVLEIAIRDVVSGKVTWDTVKPARAAADEESKKEKK